MEHLKRQFMIFCLGTGLTFIAAGLFPFFAAVPTVQAQDATPEITPEAAVETTLEALTQSTEQGASNAPASQTAGNTDYCTVCHNQPWRAVTLQDGFILNLYVDPEIITNSVHGRTNPDGAMDCVDCHGEAAFPHNGPTPDNARVYTLNAVQMCTNCHQQEASDLEHGLHEQAIARGNLDAAVCTDCHGAHDIQPATNRPQLVAGVCGDCHKSTYDEWRNSPHVDIGPFGCAKCHSPHSQELRVGDVNELCTNCHKAPGDIYIHQQHLDSATYPVTCVDCHMYRESEVEMVSVEFKPTGHTMKLDARPCNSCHEKLEASGQWSQIGNLVNERIIQERDDLQKRVNELETEVKSVETPSESNPIQLTQGLIIGLGLGITLAIVLVPRFIRSNNVGRRKGESNNDEQ
jgi:predicted CXXCH cytochrome family protein